MIMKNFQKIGFVMLMFVAVSVAFSSCYKKKDTIAVVTVVDGSENPVAGAEVTLTWVNDTLPPEVQRENLEQTATTDGSGKASFNYNELYKSGQAGVFVLDVIVNGENVGIIKVEEETTSEETVIVQ
jgi:hypothetical protein